MLIQIPTGFIDGVDLFDHCEVDEIRGRQQNYLADKKLVTNNLGHVPLILGDMLLSISTKEGLQWKGDIKKDGIYRLTTSDIETIFIRVRENTYGPRYYHEAVCSHCGHHHKNLRLDLPDLHITPLSMEDRMKSRLLILPKCKREVELKPQYLKDLYEVLKINTDKQDQVMTTVLKLSIKSIDKKEVTTKDVEDLPSSDIFFLYEQLESFKLEGKIDTSIEITCEKCTEEFKVRVSPLSLDFFTPTGASMSMNI
jgi:hypothetical protein